MTGTVRSRPSLVFWLVEGKLKLNSLYFLKMMHIYGQSRIVALQVFLVAKASIVPTINCD
jgi:hypothetical protein